MSNRFRFATHRLFKAITSVKNDDGIQIVRKADLARYMGVLPVQIERWCKGDRAMPLEFALQIIAMLKCLGRPCKLEDLVKLMPPRDHETPRQFVTKMQKRARAVAHRRYL
jgi:transcriptional regulator with XRE-family HTH domain